MPKAKKPSPSQYAPKKKGFKVGQMVIFDIHNGPSRSSAEKARVLFEEGNEYYHKGIIKEVNSKLGRYTVRDKDGKDWELHSSSIFPADN